uniref:Uncharacterized protein n=1 Tax=Sulfolobus islandicus rod-shaped virus 1 TaxID=157898 RepID=Q5W348_SIRV1|nr:hypothetical protein [Sulfolobus islandicus rod-shaped virus 1]
MIKMLIKDLKNVLNVFFANQQIKELSTEFKEPLLLTEKELEEVTGNYDYKNESRYEDIHMLEYNYREFNNIISKLEITYIKKDNKIAITEIHLWRKYEK